MLSFALPAFAAVLVTFAVPAVHMRPLQTCDYRSTLRRVDKAIGGDPSRHANSLITIGKTIADGFVSETYEATDLTKGRFVRDKSGSAESSRVVFDGRTLWNRDWTGGVHSLDGIDAKMGVLTDAYLYRYGFLRVNADKASFGCQTEGVGGVARYEVISIVPREGREVRLWIDRRSGLPAKSVQRTATLTATTTYNDYRNVDGFAVPFLIRSVHGANTSTYLVQRASFKKTQLLGSTFAPPSTTNDAEILGGARWTTVPVLVENGQVLINAFVNGRRLLFQLDTGGHAILTRETAKLLGIQPLGIGSSGGGGEGTTAQQYTGPQTLRIGQARIKRVPFYVLAYGRDFSDRGARRAPRAGIIGLELFERFAVRLNYRSRNLTLTPLHRFTYRGRGKAIPLTFEQDVPLVPARADNIPGVFQLDTGNSGGTLLFGPFLHTHHFTARYPVGFDTSGSGTGGEVHLRARRLQHLAVDGLMFQQFISYFVDQVTGAFSSRSEAGNLGYDILSHFTITFDYAHHLAYFEPIAAQKVPIYNRAGVAAERVDGQLVVTTVLPNSPASDAHIALRDRIVQINGRKGTNRSAEAFQSRTRGPIGSVLELDVEHRGHLRHVGLRLRELLCTRGATCSPTVHRITT